MKTFEDYSIEELERFKTLYIIIMIVVAIIALMTTWAFFIIALFCLIPISNCNKCINEKKQKEIERKEAEHRPERDQKARATSPRQSTAPEMVEIVPPERQEPQPEFLQFKDIPPQTDYEAYYKNGKLIDVKPRNKSIPLYEDRQIAYHARYIISDGTKYDLEDAGSIKSINIPKFNQLHGISSPTSDLSYILKMRVGMENRPHLAVPLAYKVANLMIASPVGWNKKDYYRLVAQLWSVGEVYYGDHLLKQLSEVLPFMSVDEIEYINKKSFENALNHAKEMHTDCLQVGYLCGACKDCAPYLNRIYSITGQDSRFPKLPDFILRNKGLHCNAGYFASLYFSKQTLTKYIYSENGDVTTKEVDAVKYSNRPFVDDRSEWEKQNYEKWSEDNKKRDEQDARYYSREHWIDNYNSAIEYQKVIELLGSKAPKSFTGYCRMKKNNTANYQKIVGFAKENGIAIN